LSRSQRPNQYLVCPPGFCAAKPDAESPVYPVAAATLRDRWLGLIDQQSGIERVAVSPDHLQYDIIQRSRLLHFPDSITVRFIPLGEARSTLAIYSRAHYGYSDFGVNRQRVQSWLSALQSPSPGSYQTR
jgi:uncharacterized protein (DUF1499 family)